MRCQGERLRRPALRNRQFTAIACALLVTLGGLTAVMGVLPGIQAKKALASVVTAAQDDLRTGWDPQEPGLSPAVVSGGSFGELFSTPVNGQVYAQPIVAGATVVVATENDWVYGLNAITGQVRWSVSLGRPWPDTNCTNLQPNVGITGTPVYDPSTQIVYLVARVMPFQSLVSEPVFELVGLNADTGMIRLRVPIRGVPVNDRRAPFDSATALQRTGLLMLNGWVYAAFAANCDIQPYKGYVAGIHVPSGIVTLWSDEAGTANMGGGIWQSGGGLMSDGPGRIFFASGNGTPPMAGPGRFGFSNPPQAAFGDSVVRLTVQPGGALQAADFFSPADSAFLSQADLDLGASGPVGLPFGTARYPHLLVQAGKDGRVFLLNRDNLGGMRQGPGGGDAAVSISGPFAEQFGHPAVFGNTAQVSRADPGRDYVYLVGGQDRLRALRLVVGSSGTPYLADAGDSPRSMGLVSHSPEVTSNGTDASSAIVWAVGTTNSTATDGMLEAFDAVPRAPCSASIAAPCLRMIWSAPVGIPAKFSMPAADNGRVYVGTADGHLLGFGVSGQAGSGKP